MLKAIETTYNGYRFRSRLEARWAVFFDQMGIDYWYEPEGVDLGDEWYLPDFWLPQVNMWAEVKGRKFTKHEADLADRLAAASLCPVLQLVGPPDWTTYTAIELWDTGTETPGTKPEEYVLTMTEDCFKPMPGDYTELYTTDYNQAVAASRQARFEERQ